jgi:hypothetical protein
MRRVFKQLLVACLLGMSSFSWAGEILASIPQSIDAKSHYVIYSHGRIVEGDDPMPIHSVWGVYDFPAIKKQLAESADVVLIAHHRPANTDVDSYVEMLESWVLRLTAHGVDPRHITLVGFSKGGEITALAASALKPLPINTALLATCWPGGVQNRENVTLHGRLLAIYESTDAALSCKELANRSVGLSSFQEIAITTGREHGAFYEPLAVWIEPLTEWTQQRVDE